MPSELITVTSTRDLNELANFVHDLWFDLELVQQQLYARTIKLVFTERPPGFRTETERWRKQPTVCTLHVHDVISVQLVDTEGVQFYDVNRVKFDERTRVLDILTGIPLSLAFCLNKLNLVLNIGPASEVSED